MAGHLLAAPFPADWKTVQTIQVDNSGTVKLSLPVETLDACRPQLPDLRLYDAGGRELPYRLDRPVQPPRASRGARNFQVQLQASNTVATFDTDLTQPVDSLTLDTPARDFIKPVNVEASPNGTAWETVATAQPIFRTPAGAARLLLQFRAGPWRFFRVSLDDRRATPIPLLGAQLHATAAEPAPAEPLEVRIVDRDESPGQTRLTLQTAGAHVTLAGLTLECDDALFTRPVTLSCREYLENEVREKTLVQGDVYRVALEGNAPVGSLTFGTDIAIPTRELIVTIHNGDSPPLGVRGVRAQRRPVYLTFQAASPGAYHLLSGNTRCAAPQYDLANLPSNLAANLIVPSRIVTLATNADFRISENLPEITETGTALDLRKWGFRKPIVLERGGVQQVELDLETLARCTGSFADLRVVRDDKQLPYLLERTLITRTFTPTLTQTNDVKRPSVSRFLLKLPHPSLPIQAVVFETDAPFFKREVRLTEPRHDDRGELYQVTRASTLWTRTPEQKQGRLTLRLDSPPTGDTLFLEIENGDNPALTLRNLQAHYHATRFIFKTMTTGSVALYYGNQEVAFPHYDIELVANQLLSAEKTKASLGPVEKLKKTNDSDAPAGTPNMIFWAVLGGVVVALLFVIARLLPKPASMA